MGDSGSHSCNQASRFGKKVGFSRLIVLMLGCSTYGEHRRISSDRICVRIVSGRGSEVEVGLFQAL